jgi:hypothetical protein
MVLMGVLSLSIIVQGKSFCCLLFCVSLISFVLLNVVALCKRVWMFKRNNHE